MTFFLWAVDGPLHRAERGVVDGVLARVALHRVEQLLQLEAVFEVVDLEAQLADELGEHLHLPRVGAAVYAAQEEQPGLGQLLGHRLVGREHELLDDLMALGVLFQVGAGHAAIGVEVDLHLRHRELECPALESPRAEDHRQFVHPREQRIDLGRELRHDPVLLGGRLTALFAPDLRLPHRRRDGLLRQVLVHFLVGEPAAALDRALEHVGRDASAFLGEFHHRRDGIPHFVRLQAGQVVRDDLRQHRDHAVGQIDARRPVVRLAVERRLGLHEVRHVGDVDAQQPVAVLQPFERNRIVEVAGVDGVDRDDRLIREIAPAAADRFVELLGLLA